MHNQPASTGGVPCADAESFASGVQLRQRFLSNEGERTKYHFFSDSFFPSTIKAWNSLPNEAKELSSVLAFKNYLNRNKLQSPYYFQVGSRFGQILHARLRMQCSALNADLYRKTLLKALPVSTAEVLKVHITFSLHVPYMLLQEDISQQISTNTL